MEACHLARLPGNVDFTAGASLPISGADRRPVLFARAAPMRDRASSHTAPAARSISVAPRLRPESGAYVIGTGRAADRQAALDFGANEFLNLDDEDLEDIGGVDLVFDVIGGDIQRRSASIIRPGGTLVLVVGPAEARPADGLAVDSWWIPLQVS